MAVLRPAAPQPMNFFSMTATSALIGGLLAAATAADPNWTAFFLATLGLILAHAANNMINDWFDTAGGDPNGEFPDNQISGDDRQFKFNQMLTVSYNFYFPTEYRISE